MKRQTQTLTLLCVLLTSFGLTAQNQFSNPGRLTISAGIGLLPSYMKDKSASHSLPVQLQVGFRVSKKFSMSTFAGFASATSDPRTFSDGFATYLENKSFSMGIRAELRHEVAQRVEIYGGSLLGYHHANVREYLTGTKEPYVRDIEKPTPYNPDPTSGSLLYSAFVGTTYFIKKGIGVYGEIGYGISLMNFGVTFRM